MHFRPWRDLSFRFKLIFFSGLITSISLGLAATAMLTVETRALKEDYALTVGSLADVITRNCASALAFNDPDFALQILNGLEAEPGLRFAVILDADREVFVTWTPPGAELPPPFDPESGKTGFVGNTLRVSRPVRFMGDQVGTLHVVAESTTLLDRSHGLTVWVIGLFAGILLASLALAGFLQKGLSAPIDELQEVVGEVRRSGDYGVRARQFGRDELGRLTEAVNLMLAGIQHRDRALLDSETRYADLLGRIEAVIFRVRAATGTLEFCSPGVKGLLGYDAAEFVANPDLLPSLIHPDSRIGFGNMLDEARAGRVQPDFEYRIHDREGREKWVKQRNYPVCDEEGRVESYEGFLFEVTEQVLANQDRERLEAELHQAHKLEALGTLSGGIAHDFNNILSAIMGYASMAQEEIPAGHPFHQYLEPILRASDRASQLTKQILSFSRLGNPHQSLLDPALVVGEALTLIRASLPTTIDIKNLAPQTLPLVMADETQLHQVIMNLCTNAGHAMEETGGLLELRAEPAELPDNGSDRPDDLPPGRYVRITVSDTGQGIPADVLPRIFEPFFTTKEEGKGTGMGLSVVYGIVREHKGAITVTSTPGEGTRFEILLPAAAVPEAAVESAATGLAATGGNVMVVDDEHAIAQVTTLMLERIGCRVRTFTNPHLALAAMRDEPGACDLLVTDYTMPNIQGLDLAREFIGLRPGLPVLLCTGNPARVKAADLADLPTVRLAPKPLAIKQFSQMVRECLGNWQAQPPTPRD